MLVIALKLIGLLTENFRKPTNKSLTNVHKRKHKTAVNNACYSTTIKGTPNEKFQKKHRQNV